MNEPPSYFYPSDNKKGMSNTFEFDIPLPNYKHGRNPGGSGDNHDPFVNN